MCGVGSTVIAMQKLSPCPMQSGPTWDKSYPPCRNILTNKWIFSKDDPISTNPPHTKMRPGPTLDAATLAVFMSWIPQFQNWIVVADWPLLVVFVSAEDLMFWSNLYMVPWLNSDLQLQHIKKACPFFGSCCRLGKCCSLSWPWESLKWGLAL